MKQKNLIHFYRRVRIRRAFSMSFILFFCMIHLISFSQNKAKTDKVNQKYNETSIVNAIQDCPDLQAQIVTIFGANYSVNDIKVIKQLEKNITDESQNRCVRKNSLKAIYGSEYDKKLYLIETKSKTKN